MTKVITDLPLVTFALFAYNQEKYIRKAVEGAFSQTYEPLEIILSDDFSTDGTFEIMQLMAAEYDGPHKVRLRQNPVNLGLIGHVNTVSREALGSIIVIAAGDDISLPLRAEKLAAAFAGNPSALLAHSSAYTIDEAGVRIGEKHPPPTQSLKSLVKSASIYIGATGAIHRRLIESFDPIQYKATYEDLIFGTRAALVGDLHFVNEKLVDYRPSTGIIYKSRNSRGRISRRRKEISQRIDTMKQRRVDAKSSSHASRESLINLIDDEISRAVARSQFYERRLTFAIGLFGPNCIHYLRAISSETKYLLGLIN